MIFYGTRAPNLQNGSIKNIICPNCGEETDMIFSVYGRYVHVYWIPIAAMKKQIFFECNKCRKTYELKDLPPQIQEKYQKQNAFNEPKTPIWYFAGGVVLLGILIFAVCYGIKAKSDEKIFIKKPESGDVYRLKIEENGNYTTAKVIEVFTDSMTIYTNEMETDKQSGINEIDI